MRTEAVIAEMAGVQLVELRRWVARGWVSPDEAAGAWEFRDIDVARVRLIRTLRDDMEVGEEVMPVVLSLLDQVYDLRHALREVLAAVGDQDERVRAAVAAALTRETAEP
jgi:chaperone modulatory protein CbpM